jgi:hypothetical protein
MLHVPPRFPKVPQCSQNVPQGPQCSPMLLNVFQCSPRFPNVLQCSSPLGMGVLIAHGSDEKFLFIIAFNFFGGNFNCAKKSVKKCK